MLLSVWLGIVLASGQTGCSTLNKDASLAVPMAQSALTSKPSAKHGLLNPDLNQIPKVPPPGVRMVYSSVPMSQPYIAMTFDDGPHATNTARLLDMLKQRNIKATFFVVGKNVREYPDIVRRILAEGHEIGNHTWDHKALSGMSAERVHQELAMTHNAVLEVAGYQMRVMRPPYGATNLRVKQQCYQEFGYPTIMWSVDPLDWKRPGSSVVAQRIISNTHAGAIILAHDIHEPTINAMPDTLDTLLSKGYRFVTVSQLLNMQSETPAPGASPAVKEPPAFAPQPTSIQQTSVPAALPPAAGGAVESALR